MARDREETETTTPATSEIATTERRVSKISSYGTPPSVIKTKDIPMAKTGGVKLSATTGYMKLNTGEYIDRNYYNTLDREQQEELNKLGVEKYREKYFVKLKTGDLVGRDFYNSLDKKQQKELNKLGMDAYRQKYFVELKTGEFIDKATYNNLGSSPQNLSAINQYKEQIENYQEQIENIEATGATAETSQRIRQLQGEIRKLEGLIEATSSDKEVKKHQRIINERGIEGYNKWIKKKGGVLVEGVGDFLGKKYIALHPIYGITKGDKTQSELIYNKILEEGRLQKVLDSIPEFKYSKKETPERERGGESVEKLLIDTPYPDDFFKEFEKWFYQLDTEQQIAYLFEKEQQFKGLLPAGGFDDPIAYKSWQENVKKIDNYEDVYWYNLFAQERYGYAPYSYGKGLATVHAINVMKSQGYSDSEINQIMLASTSGNQDAINKAIQTVGIDKYSQGLGILSRYSGVQVEEVEEDKEKIKELEQKARSSEATDEEKRNYVFGRFGNTAGSVLLNTVGLEQAVKSSVDDFGRVINERGEPITYRAVTGQIVSGAVPELDNYIVVGRGLVGKESFDNSIKLYKPVEIKTKTAIEKETVKEVIEKAKETGIWDKAKELFGEIVSGEYEYDVILRENVDTVIKILQKFPEQFAEQIGKLIDGGVLQPRQVFASEEGKKYDDSGILVPTDDWVIGTDEFGMRMITWRQDGHEYKVAENRYPWVSKYRWYKDGEWGTADIQCTQDSCQIEYAPIKNMMLAIDKYGFVSKVQVAEVPKVTEEKAPTESEIKTANENVKSWLSSDFNDAIEDKTPEVKENLEKQFDENPLLASIIAGVSEGKLFEIFNKDTVEELKKSYKDAVIVGGGDVVDPSHYWSLTPSARVELDKSGIDAMQRYIESQRAVLRNAGFKVSNEQEITIERESVDLETGKITKYTDTYTIPEGFNIVEALRTAWKSGRTDILDAVYAIYPVSEIQKQTKDFVINPTSWDKVKNEWAKADVFSDKGLGDIFAGQPTKEAQRIIKGTSGVIPSLVDYLRDNLEYYNDRLSGRSQDTWSFMQVFLDDPELSKKIDDPKVLYKEVQDRIFVPTSTDIKDTYITPTGGIAKVETPIYLPASDKPVPTYFKDITTALAIVLGKEAVVDKYIDKKTYDSLLSEAAQKVIDNREAYEKAMHEDEMKNLQEANKGFYFEWVDKNGNKIFSFGSPYKNVTDIRDYYSNMMAGALSSGDKLRYEYAKTQFDAYDMQAKILENPGKAFEEINMKLMGGVEDVLKGIKEIELKPTGWTPADEVTSATLRASAGFLFTALTLVSAIPVSLAIVNANAMGKIFNENPNIFKQGQKELVQQIPQFGSFVLNQGVEIMKDPAFGLGTSAAFLAGVHGGLKVVKGVYKTGREALVPYIMEHSNLGLELTVPRAQLRGKMSPYDAITLEKDVVQKWGGKEYIPEEIAELNKVNPLMSAYVTSLAKAVDIEIKDHRGKIIARVNPSQMGFGNVLYSIKPDINTHLLRIGEKGKDYTPAGAMQWWSPNFSYDIINMYMQNLKGLDPGAKMLRASAKDFRPYPPDIYKLPSFEAMRNEIVRRAELPAGHPDALEPGIYTVFKYHYSREPSGVMRPTFELELITPATFEPTVFKPTRMTGKIKTGGDVMPEVAILETYSPIRGMSKKTGAGIKLEQKIPIVIEATANAMAEGKGIPTFGELYATKFIYRPYVMFKNLFRSSRVLRRTARDTDIVTTPRRWTTSTMRFESPPDAVTTMTAQRILAELTPEQKISNIELAKKLGEYVDSEGYIYRTRDKHLHQTFEHGDNWVQSRVGVMLEHPTEKGAYILFNETAEPPNVWSMPGGQIDPVGKPRLASRIKRGGKNITLEEAAREQIISEIGVDLKDIRPAKIHEGKTTEHSLYGTPMFDAKPTSMDFKISAGRWYDYDKGRWVTYPEVRAARVFRDGDYGIVSPPIYIELVRRGFDVSNIVIADEHLPTSGIKQYPKGSWERSVLDKANKIEPKIFKDRNEYDIPEQYKKADKSNEIKVDIIEPEIVTMPTVNPVDIVLTDKVSIRRKVQEIYNELILEQKAIERELKEFENPKSEVSQLPEHIKTEILNFDNFRLKEIEAIRNEKYGELLDTLKENPNYEVILSDILKELDEPIKSSLEKPISELKRPKEIEILISEVKPTSPPKITMNDIYVKIYEKKFLTRDEVQYLIDNRTDIPSAEITDYVVDTIKSGNPILRAEMIERVPIYDIIYIVNKEARRITPSVEVQKNNAEIIKAIADIYGLKYSGKYRGEPEWVENILALDMSSFQPSFSTIDKGISIIKKIDITNPTDFSVVVHELIHNHLDNLRETNKKFVVEMGKLEQKLREITGEKDLSVQYGFANEVINYELTKKITNFALLDVWQDMLRNNIKDSNVRSKYIKAIQEFIDIPELKLNVVKMNDAVDILQHVTPEVTKGIGEPNIIEPLMKSGKWERTWEIKPNELVNLSSEVEIKKGKVYSNQPPEATIVREVLAERKDLAQNAVLRFEDGQEVHYYGTELKDDPLRKEIIVISKEEGQPVERKVGSLLYENRDDLIYIRETQISENYRGLKLSSILNDYLMEIASREGKPISLGEIGNPLMVHHVNNLIKDNVIVAVERMPHIQYIARADSKVALELLQKVKDKPSEYKQIKRVRDSDQIMNDNLIELGYPIEVIDKIESYTDRIRIAQNKIKPSELLTEYPELRKVIKPEELLLKPISEVTKGIGEVKQSEIISNLTERGGTIEIKLGEDIVGGADVAIRDDGIMITRITVPEKYRGQDVATKLQLEVQRLAEESGKPFYAGILSKEGEAFLKALDEKGIIKLEPVPEGFVKIEGADVSVAYKISKGEPYREVPREVPKAEVKESAELINVDDFLQLIKDKQGEIDKTQGMWKVNIDAGESIMPYSLVKQVTDSTGKIVYYSNYPPIPKGKQLALDTVRAFGVLFKEKGKLKTKLEDFGISPNAIEYLLPEHIAVGGIPLSVTYAEFAQKRGFNWQYVDILKGETPAPNSIWYMDWYGNIWADRSPIPSKTGVIPEGLRILKDFVNRDTNIEVSLSNVRSAVDNFVADVRVNLLRIEDNVSKVIAELQNLKDAPETARQVILTNIQRITVESESFINKTLKQLEDVRSSLVKQLENLKDAPEYVRLQVVSLINKCRQLADELRFKLGEFGTNVKIAISELPDNIRYEITAIQGKLDDLVIRMGQSVENFSEFVKDEASKIKELPYEISKDVQIVIANINNKVIDLRIEVNNQIAKIRVEIDRIASEIPKLKDLPERARIEMMNLYINQLAKLNNLAKGLLDRAKSLIDEFNNLATVEIPEHLKAVYMEVVNVLSDIKLKIQLLIFRIEDFIGKGLITIEQIPEDIRFRLTELNSEVKQFGIEAQQFAVNLKDKIKLEIQGQVAGIDLRLQNLYAEARYKLNELVIEVDNVVDRVNQTAVYIRTQLPIDIKNYAVDNAKLMVIRLEARINSTLAFLNNVASDIRNMLVSIKDIPDNLKQILNNMLIEVQQLHDKLIASFNSLKSEIELAVNRVKDIPENVKADLNELSVRINEIVTKSSEVVKELPEYAKETVIKTAEAIKEVPSELRDYYDKYIDRLFNNEIWDRIDELPIAIKQKAIELKDVIQKTSIKSMLELADLLEKSAYLEDLIRPIIEKDTHYNKLYEYYFNKVLSEVLGKEPVTDIGLGKSMLNVMEIREQVYLADSVARKAIKDSPELTKLDKDTLYNKIMHERTSEILLSRYGIKTEFSLYEYMNLVDKLNKNIDKWQKEPEYSVLDIFSKELNDYRNNLREFTLAGKTEQLDLLSAINPELRARMSKADRGELNPKQYEQLLKDQIKFVYGKEPITNQKLFIQTRLNNYKAYRQSILDVIYSDNFGENWNIAVRRWRELGEEIKRYEKTGETAKVAELKEELVKVTEDINRSVEKVKETIRDVDRYRDYGDIPYKPERRIYLPYNISGYEELVRAYEKPYAMTYQEYALPEKEPKPYPYTKTYAEATPYPEPYAEATPYPKPYAPPYAPPYVPPETPPYKPPYVPPEGPPVPPPIYPPVGPPLIKHKKYDSLTDWQRESAVCWRQGVMYKMRYYPWRQEDIINTRKPIEGVKYYEGPESAYKSVVQKYPGRIPAEMSFKMGVQTTTFRSYTDKDGGVKVELIFTEIPEEAKHEQRLSKKEREELGLPEKPKKVRRKKVKEPKEAEVFTKPESKEQAEKGKTEFVPIIPENTPVLTFADLQSGKSYEEVKAKEAKKKDERQESIDRLFPEITIFNR